MIRDFNLPNVIWMSPVNLISQHFKIQNEYFHVFTTKGLYWFIEDDTRYNLLRNI